MVAKKEENENISVYNKLKSVPDYAQKKITGGRLSGMTDIKPQWRILVMTEIFGICGFGWKYEIVEIKYSNPDAKGQIACFVKINLFIKQEDKWSDAIPGVGGSSFITLEKNGLYLSDECEKMALTDSLSVAMKAIGVGADVYMGHGSKYDKPTESNEQLKTAIPQKTKMGEKPFLQAIEKIMNGTEISVEALEKVYELSEVQKKQITATILKYK